MASDEQRYLRDVQYRHPDRLAARSLLHTRYGRGDWFEWLAENIPLPQGGVVADVGCGAGAFWTNAPGLVPDDLRLHLFDISEGMVQAAGRAMADLLRTTCRVGTAAKPDHPAPTFGRPGELDPNGLPSG